MVYTAFDEKEKLSLDTDKLFFCLHIGCICGSKVFMHEVQCFLGL